MFWLLLISASFQKQICTVYIYFRDIFKNKYIYFIVMMPDVLQRAHGNVMFSLYLIYS